jgi:RNA polymerase sigma-70 factor, ECF subfamily
VTRIAPPGPYPRDAMLRIVPNQPTEPARIEPRVQAAIAGDPTAIRELLVGLLPRIRNLVRYLVRGDREVDDIAQDALLAVLQDLPSYRGEGRFEAWVDRVVARLTIAHLRKRRAQWRRDLDFRSELTLVKGSATVDEYLQRRRAVQLLDELPFEQRHALVLHHVLDMTVPEVATELGLPMETVRSRLRLAKGRLRQGGVLAGDEGDEEGGVP